MPATCGLPMQTQTAAMDTISWFTYYFKLILSYGDYYLSYVYNAYQDYPTVVKIAAFVISFSLLAIITLFVLIGIKSRRRAKRAKTYRRLDERFGQSIEYLLSKDCKPTMSRQEVVQLLGVEEELKNKKEVLRNKRERMLFCELIYNKRISDKSVSGRRANLHQLLDLFNLREFLETAVSLGNNVVKCDAMQMMRTFKVYISPWVINKLLISKVKRVERLAMYSSIMSSADSDLDYFETSFFDDNCCIHDEIELGYVLQRRRNNGLKLPNLANWAHHQKNPNTKCVFVRLMRRFDQREFCFQLVNLFNKSDHKKLIEEISRTWGYLNYADGEKLLVDSLLMQPDDTKVAIMHAVTRMASGQSLDVLTEEYRESTNPHVRFEALRCLYNYGEQGRARFHELEGAATEKEQKFFTFFHNPITLGRIRLDKEQAYKPSVETIYNSDV